MFCFHRWKIVEKEVLLSTLEQLSAAGALEISGGSPSKMSHKPCIVTKRCEKCGTEKVERI